MSPRGLCAPAELSLSLSLSLLALLASACAALVLAASASAALVHLYESRLTEAAGAPFGAVKGLAVDGTGNLYVSDAGNHAIDKFDSTGAPVLSWGINGQITQAGLIPFARPIGLAVDGSGNLWATDSARTVVDEFEPSGGFLLESTGEAHLSGFADSVAFSNSAKHVYVADSNNDDLWVLNPDGSFSSDIKGPWGSGCCYISVAADNSGGPTGGDLYVSSGGHASVYRIDGTGTPAPFSETASYIEGATLTGTPEGPFGRLSARIPLAVDSVGNIYVADIVNDRVDEFDSSGKYLADLTGTPTGAGGTIVPFGAISAIGIGVSTGKLYVADEANAAVDVFGPTVVIPDVATKPASALTATSATLKGEVDPLGLEVKECAFEYGETQAYGHLAPCVESAAEIGAGSSPVPVHADITALRPGTGYHFRLIAANTNGKNQNSGDQSFFTGASIDSMSVSQVTATSATLEAELNPHGLPTEYHFQYLTEAAFEANGGSFEGTESPIDVPIPDASAGAGTADTPVTTPAQGLTPATGYHYRIVAHNSAGTVEGPQHIFTTQATGGSSRAAGLIDDRQWQLVSPPDKHGGTLLGLGESVTQAAADGSAITYVSNEPIEFGAQGNAGGSQVLSTRGDAGWSTRDIAPPHQKATGAIFGFGQEYRFFSTDLSTAVVQPFGPFTPCQNGEGFPQPCLSPESSEQTAFLRSNFSGGPARELCTNSCYTPLVTGAAGHANVPPGTHFGGGTEDPECTGEIHARICGPFFLGASPDATHVVLDSVTPLVQGAPAGQFSIDGEPLGSLYEWSSGQLKLVSVLPESGVPAPTEPFLALGRGVTTRNAISADGTRVVWSEGLVGNLYLSDTAAEQTEAVQLDKAEEVGGKVCSGCNSGGGVFQTASSDGGRIFFTDSNRLTANAGAGTGGGDLYECLITVAAGKPRCALTDLTPKQGNESAGVLGHVLGASADGSSVYFLAEGVLDHNKIENGGGEEEAQAGRPNLYLSHEGRISFIAGLSGEDLTDVREGGAQPARVSPSGQWLAFMSARSLTGYDNRDAVSGRRDAEIYVYGAESSPGRPHLACVSCDPTGARPVGVEYGQLSSAAGGGELVVGEGGEWTGPSWVAALLPLAPAFMGDESAYQGRYLTDEGRVFFNSPDALVSQDGNGAWDVYEHEPAGVGGCTSAAGGFSARSGGCIGLISSGTSGQNSAFLDASESGADVFFMTAARLVAQDVDSEDDVYDAHECGTEAPCFPPPPPPTPACEGDACQSQVAAPNDPTPGSLTFTGPGNLKPVAILPPSEAAGGLTSAQKLAKALKACRKHRRGGRKHCEASARKRYGAKKASRRRRTGG